MTRTNSYSPEDISRVEGATGLIYAGNLVVDEWGLIPVFLKPASKEDMQAKVLKVNGRGSFPLAPSNRGEADE